MSIIHQAPQIFGMSGIPTNPPTFIDVGGGALSDMFAFGNTNDVDPADRTIDRMNFGSPGAGDLAIAMFVGPGYIGQSSAILREGDPSFMAWANVIGSVFFTFDNSPNPDELSGGLHLRECTGDFRDTCRIGSNGPFPTATQIAVMSGNPFTGLPAAITAANGTEEDQNDADGSVCFGGMFGGVNNCIEFFVSWKRGSAAEAAVGKINMPSGIIQLGSVAGLDNGFDQGMMAAWGYNYSEDNLDAFDGTDATQDVDNEDYSASVGARYRTDDS